jgi:tetratricopeptide (TPR) repeat protein
MIFRLLARLFRSPANAQHQGEPTSASTTAANATAECHKNRGNELFREQRIEEALACYWQALAIDPDYGDAQWNVAIASLFLGDYATGFQYFEKRFRAGDKAHLAHLQGVVAMMSGKRFWKGEQLRGENLLVWTEQGLGDSLMFLRYLGKIKQKGDCRLLVACEPQLVRLMESLPCIDEVVSKDAPLSPTRFDLHCSLLSLPHLFGTTMAMLPIAVSYLSVPPAMKRSWDERIAELDGFKVGLVWAGGEEMANDALRSLALEAFAPLTKIAGIRLVSLQKGEPARQLAALGWPIVDWMDDCVDLLDTAALVDGIDLVISADTAVAHLAGALGKPVWLLNRFESEWRWMLGREDSPWYPSMRIFRQPVLHDWESVIGEVAVNLGILVAAQGECE